MAGTVSTDSAIRVRVEAVGDDTALAGIQRLVAEAQASGSRAQALADRFAALLFYVATAAGIVTFVVWWALGDVDDAVVRTVTVLVIACPHALGLAIPLVIALSTAVSARAGILVKDRLALERMRTIDAVLFDKTGTLTRAPTSSPASPPPPPTTRTTCCASPAASSPTASTRSPGPSSPPPASAASSPPPGLPVAHRPRRRGHRRRRRVRRRRARPCCGSGDLEAPPSSSGAVERVAAAGRRGALPGARRRGDRGPRPGGRGPPRGPPGRRRPPGRRASGS